MKKIRGRKVHQLMERARLRKLKKSRGVKRFFHVDLSWRGDIRPNFNPMAGLMTLAMTLSLMKRGYNPAKRMNRGGGK